MNIHARSISIISICLLVGTFVSAHAQQPGLERSLSRMIDLNIQQNEQQMCSRHALAGVANVLGRTVVDSISDPLQPFQDLSLSACYRDVIWLMEDNAKDQLATIGDIQTALCIEQARRCLPDDRECLQERERSTRVISAELDETRARHIFLTEGTRMLRYFGMRGTAMSHEEKEMLFRTANVSENLVRTILKLDDEMEINPYYSPLYHVSNITGIQQIMDDSMPDRYTKIIRERSGESDISHAEKIKILASASKEKWRGIEDALEIFFNGTQESRDALTASLNENDRRKFHDSLRILRATIPYLLTHIDRCGGASFDAIIDSINSNIQRVTKVTAQFGQIFEDPFVQNNPKNEMQKQLIQMRKNVYARICSQITDVFKKTRRPLAELPYLITLNGEHFCAPPSPDKDARERHADVDAAVKANIKRPRSVENIARENFEITISDLLNEKLEEESSYGYEVSIAEMRIDYETRYAHGSSEKSQILKEKIDGIIHVLRKISYKDEAQYDSRPALQKVFDALYTLQSRQHCGSCSVNQNEFVIGAER